jgi:ribosomal protein L40E
MVDELDKNLNANREKRRHLRYLDWRTISSFGYVFGALSLLVGLYAYLYYQTTLIGQIGLAFTPYRNYAIPILIAGIVLLIMGYVTEKRAREKIKSVEKQQPIANIGICPNCGAKRDFDAQYCKKCGKKFE